MSHIAVERNRRRMMNEHLKALRSLTPCLYIKRGDQASIIGGVIEFINELHQVLQSLEAQKRRKSLSPRHHFLSRQLTQSHSQKSTHPRPGSVSSANEFRELGACCNSEMADVEAKISGSNVHLRIFSKRSPEQLVRMIHVLEKLSFEILHLNISSMEDTVLYSFVVKIGFDCQVSVDELVVEIQRTFAGS
ncbi:hypothetical protein M569_08886, partial [Genlisea aurea]